MADEPAFDFDAVFDPDDYLYFYEPMLTPERTQREVALIWTLLGLRPGQAVLDLACGHGRVAVPLAAMGVRVTGLDRSPGFLARAREAAARQGVEVEWVEGDMRRLPWRDRFDAAFNVFTSFGYFVDEENLEVLRQVAAALRPGGRFLLETQHRDALLARFAPFNVVERGDDFLIDAHRWDPVTGRVVTQRTVIRQGRVRRGRFFVRLYTPAELGALLRQAGLEPVGFYDENGAPLSPESRRLVAVARKPAGAGGAEAGGRGRGAAPQEGGGAAAPGGAAARPGPGASGRPGAPQGSGASEGRSPREGDEPAATGAVPPALVPAPLAAFLHLYHRGRFFESHEVLEEAWRRCRSDFYHGLIILAAAFVRRDRGTPRGVRRNLAKARRYLERYRPHYLGIDVEAILAFADQKIRAVERAGDPEGDALRRLVPDLPLPVHPGWVRGDEPEWDDARSDSRPGAG
ncbi:DUF309 domain-containing protein [Thermaerobacter composti]|uniref:DUF309 domain-containing protein n=1 Tax=Thermaerobacter composti TaxID=554949 RepID=A0ABZ0QRJ2_9FIRM|nr:DUF309 domain-containing protein [Thermaerobacter composti]WPD19382.1 DUF309 domain-containing protein [Thermaerobacter composti]